MMGSTVDATDSGMPTDVRASMIVELKDGSSDGAGVVGDSGGLRTNEGFGPEVAYEEVVALAGPD